jgi:FkbM family methyltransferase
VGYFALIGAKAVGPSGKVYCIEPAPDNVRLLMKNIAINGYEDRTEVFQYLVGDHNGMEKLYLSEWANVHSLSESRGGRGSVDVPMVTLDSFLENNEIDPSKVDFIRMDIEGYEVMAFQGMKKILESKHPFKIFMEFHPGYYAEWGWTFEKLLRYLYGYGFRIREIAQHRQFDEQGKARPVILRDPSLEEVLASPVFNRHDGSQAFLERA